MAGDIHWDNVSLLLPFDDDLQDVSSQEHAVIASGSAAVTSSVAKFGGASCAFPTTSDMLTVPYSSVFDFGSGDLTIEAWVYLTSLVDSNLIGTWSSDSLGGWVVHITSSELFFDTRSSNTTGTLTRAPCSPASNQWIHVAVSVESGVRRLFLNGVLLTNNADIVIGGGYAEANAFSHDVHIGKTPQPSYPLSLPGYVDGLRITKGVARCTEDFTPPPQASPIGPVLSDPAIISGLVQLDNTPVQANLYLVDLTQCSTVQSSAITGAYTFSDPGDNSVIPDSTNLVVVCDYGDGSRPLVRGPVVPVTSS